MYVTYLRVSELKGCVPNYGTLIMGDTEIVIHAKQVCERELSLLISLLYCGGLSDLLMDSACGPGGLQMLNFASRLVRGCSVGVRIVLSTCLFCIVASAFRVIRWCSL